MTDVDLRKAGVDRQNIADTINQGISFEQYKSDLVEKEKEIRALLPDADRDGREKQNLHKQLARVEQLRLDERASYNAHVKDLRERIAQLDQLSGQIPDKLIKEARQALVGGDHEKADRLFSQIEEQADPHILVAAASAYQRGKLAEDDINYYEAFEHYQLAAQLAPDNMLYLSEAGAMAGIIAMYPRAIEYYELVLASDLKTYGEDHPQVAIYRNNLGMAWDSLGEYELAIEYYELALVTLKVKLGESHPHTLSTAESLALVKEKIK